VVTVLFADIRGSTELIANRDPEEGQTLLAPVLKAMIEAVRLYEGTVNQVLGDGLMALFGAPVAREDHALRACLAALRMPGIIPDSIRRPAAPMIASSGSVEHSVSRSRIHSRTTMSSILGQQSRHGHGQS
jgi:class 3 adenylate cyclase